MKSLSDQIHKVKEAAALEAVVYYDSQEKQQKMLRRMEEKVGTIKTPVSFLLCHIHQVQQYRHRCTELEDKLDSAIVSSGADPSKVCVVCVCVCVFVKFTIKFGFIYSCLQL